VSGASRDPRGAPPRDLVPARDPPRATGRPRARGLLLLGLAILIGYGVATLAGLRDEVAVLTGTFGSAGSAVGGVLYVLLHLAATVLAPILLLGAALIALARRLLLARPPR